MIAQVLQPIERHAPKLRALQDEIATLEKSLKAHESVLAGTRGKQQSNPTPERSGTIREIEAQLFRLRTLITSRQRQVEMIVSGIDAAVDRYIDTGSIDGVFES